MVMALDGFARVYVRGDQARTRALVRAVIAQAAAFHAPDDLLVAVCASHDRRPQWEYLKWLPHALHPTRTDRLGPVRCRQDRHEDDREDDRQGWQPYAGARPAADAPAGAEARPRQGDQDDQSRQGDQADQAD